MPLTDDEFAAEVQRLKEVALGELLPLVSRLEAAVMALEAMTARLRSKVE